jgi:hypothetical protein
MDKLGRMKYQVASLVVSLALFGMGFTGYMRQGVIQWHTHYRTVGRTLQCGAGVFGYGFVQTQGNVCSDMVNGRKLSGWVVAGNGMGMSVMK